MRSGFTDPAMSHLADAIECGNYDADIDAIKAAIEYRQDIRDGKQIHCPGCEDLLVLGESHVHDRVRYTHVEPEPYVDIKAMVSAIAGNGESPTTS